MGRKHDLLTKAELAERFVVTTRTIENWTAAGMPQRTRSGRVVFSWVECYQWREQQIRDDARATRHAGADPTAAVQMAELKLREQLAITEQAEMDVAERRRQTCTIPFMREEFKRFALAVRSRMLTIPASWPGPLQPCVTAVDYELVLQDLVNEMLPMFAEYAGDDGEPETASEETHDDADPEEPPPAEDTGS